MATPRTLLGQGHIPLVELDLLKIRWFGAITVGRPTQIQIATRPTHRAQPLGDHVINGLFFLRRAHHFLH